MNCPICGVRGGIKDTRQAADGSMLRKYACADDHKWKTVEQLDLVYDERYVKQARTAPAKLAEARESEL